MKQILFTHSVNGKRDLVLVRQRARQIGALLGFSAQDQAGLAAGVFALACQVYRRRGRTTWNFSVENRRFRIGPQTDNAWLPGVGSVGIAKLLPEQAAMSGPDIGWVARELSRLGPVDVFGEMQKLNQELLGALLEIRAFQGDRAMKPAA